MALIDDDPPFYPNWWADMGAVVAAMVGGIEVEPLMDPPPPPGSVEAENQQRFGAVPKGEFTSLIRARLAELVSMDVYEAFLVRAVRDELVRYVTLLAATGQTDERREAMRRGLRDFSEDPTQIERYRQSLARSIPEAATWSDDQVAERLQSMAESSLLDPTTADAALDRWTAKRHFDERMGELLSDTDINTWASRSRP